MRIIDRYLIRETLVAFLLGVAVFSAFLVAGELILRVLKLLMEKDAPPGLALEYFFLRLPWLVAMSFPMSMLLACIFAIGRLTHDREILALLSGGVSFNRLLLPLLLVGALVGALTFLFHRDLVPLSQQGTDRVMQKIKSVRGIAPSVVPLVLVEPPRGRLERVIIADRFDDERGILEGVEVIEYRGGKPYLFISASKAVWRHGVEWRFVKGFWQTISPNGEGVSNSFVHLTRRLNKTPQDFLHERLEPEQMLFSQLRQKIAYEKQRGVPPKVLNELLVELYDRYAIAFACVVVSLVGAPVGFRTRRGGYGLALGLSVVVILIYESVHSWGRILGRSGTLSPFIGSWLANILGLVIGSIMMIRVRR